MMRFPAFALFFIALSSFGQASGFHLTSPDFSEGTMIPRQFTCEGQNTSPALEISGAPPGAKSLVLVVDDPDAPSGTFTHWLVWNIPPATKKIAHGISPAGSVQGRNDFGSAGYSGPCPPSGTHRYFFRLSALDISLQLPAGARRAEFDDAIRGHVLGTAALMGRYAKSQ